jgi:hypothetical protein
MEKENAKKQTLEQLHDRRKQEMRKHVPARMTMLEQNPERVMSYF